MYKNGNTQALHRVTFTYSTKLQTEKVEIKERPTHIENHPQTPMSAFHQRSTCPWLDVQHLRMYVCTCMCHRNMLITSMIIHNLCDVIHILHLPESIIDCVLPREFECDLLTFQSKYGALGLFNPIASMRKRSCHLILSENTNILAMMKNNSLPKVNLRSSLS